MNGGVKLWHDDVRRPPDDSWTWARTNIAAQRILSLGGVMEASLDHDLGAHEADPDHPDALYIKGASPDGTGLDLVRWMCETGHVPSKVTIHSWNPVGAERMMRTFADHGWLCAVEPFAVPR